MPYDLRYAFATRYIIRRIDSGIDVMQILPNLSAYMDHSELTFTLDSADVHELDGVTADLMSRFTETMVGYAPVTIAEKPSALRQYFKYAFLREYVSKPIEVFLPHPPQRLRAKLPTVWSEEQIEQLIHSVDITTPTGKRDYAILLLRARHGLRIGDILSLTKTSHIKNGLRTLIIQ